MNWNMAITSNWKHLRTLIVSMAVTVLFLRSILSYRSSNGEYSINAADWLTVDMPDVDLSTMDADDMSPEQMFDYFAWPNASSCRSTRHIGGVAVEHEGGTELDGQKAVCMDAQVVPVADNCIVYSFGINNEWSFDDAMAEYGCHVFSFDPKMNEDPDRGVRVHFVNTGLHKTDTEILILSGTESAPLTWKMRTLSSIHKSLMPRHGHDIIDYLKLDISSAEWNVLPQLMESGMLSKVRQLAVEIHLEKEDSLQAFRTKVRTLKKIEQEGMIRFRSRAIFRFGTYFSVLDRRVNNCFEIAWYNKHLQRKL